MAGLAGRTRAVVIGTIVIVTAGVIAVVTMNGSDDAPEGGAATTVPPVSTTTTVASTTTSLIETSVELSNWVGEYIWSEFVEGDPGSDQTVIHRLELDEVPEDATIISGTLAQEGFQTFAVMDILGVPGDGFLTIEFVAVTEGSAPYTEAEALFRLAGNPQRPETTVVGLVTLVPDPPPGTLFVRDAGEVVVAEPPATVWGVDAETFDLVEIEISSGAELRRVAGWGVDLAERSVGGGQALQFVEVEASTSIWVDDCCEPAFGTTFRIDPETTSLDDARLRVTGLGAELSFDGRLVAVGVGDIGIQILDAQSGAEVVSPDSLAPLIAAPDDAADFVFPTPLTWLGDTTLAVAVSSVDRTTITVLDVTDPLAPTSIGDPITIDGTIADGDMRFDGRIVALADRPTSPFKELVVIDVPTASVLERIELADGTNGIDFDGSRRHLLIVDGEGMLELFGKAGFDHAIGPFIDAGW
jgi:hypothetical protein